MGSNPSPGSHQGIQLEDSKKSSLCRGMWGNLEPFRTPFHLVPDVFRPIQHRSRCHLPWLGTRRSQSNYLTHIYTTPNCVIRHSKLRMKFRFLGQLIHPSITFLDYNNFFHQESTVFFIPFLIFRVVYHRFLFYHYPLFPIPMWDVMLNSSDCNILFFRANIPAFRQISRPSPNHLDHINS